MLRGRESRFEGIPGNSIYGAAKELRQAGKSVDLNVGAKDMYEAAQILTPLCSSVLFDRNVSEEILYDSLGVTGAWDLKPEELLVVIVTLTKSDDKWKVKVVRTNKETKDFVSLKFVGKMNLENAKPFIAPEDLNEKI